jgi:hypothetical protein
LNNRKINFNLVKPTGMDWCVDRNNIFPSLDEPGIRSNATVRGAIIHDPEDSSRRTVRFLTHDLLHKTLKRFDSGFLSKPAEDLCPVNVPSRKIGKSPFPFVFMLNAHDKTSFGRQGLCLSFPGLDASFFVRRDDIIIGPRGNPCHIFWYKSNIGPALAINCGSRGNIQLRYCHGLMASLLSHLQIVMPLMLATIPCSRTYLFSSLRLKRDSGMSNRDGTIIDVIRRVKE